MNPNVHLDFTVFEQTQQLSIRKKPDIFTASSTYIKTELSVFYSNSAIFTPASCTIGDFLGRVHQKNLINYYPLLNFLTNLRHKPKNNNNS